MAKSSRVSVSSGSGVSLSRLRSLCTAAERKLLELSESTGLSKAAHAEVHALMTRARSARDKWRAMVGQQTRVVKRSPKAVAEANARSHAKAELFDGAVKRFEVHLKTAASAVTSAAQSAVKSLTGRTKTPKRARVTGHRASRAGVRKELSRQLAALNPVVAKPAAAKAKPVASKPAVAAAAQAVVKATTCAAVSEATCAVSSAAMLAVVSDAKSSVSRTTNCAVVNALACAVVRDCACAVVKATTSALVSATTCAVLRAARLLVLIAAKSAVSSDAICVVPKATACWVVKACACAVVIA